MTLDACIDLDGTPSLISVGNKDLTVGCAGTGRLRFLGTEQIAASTPVEGSAAATVAGSGTIAVAPWNRITTAGAVTGVILAAGTSHGQKMIVTVDKDASGTVTMAAAGTSRVATGTGCVIPVGGLKTFIWDATDVIWNAS